MADIDALVAEHRAGLEGVTPGEWSVDGFNLGGVIARAPGKTHVTDWRHLAVCHYENTNWRKDAAHIARCSPENISALLDALEAERSKRVRLEEALAEALDGWAEGAQYKGDYLLEKHGDMEEIENLRALLSHSSSKGESRE